MCIPRPLAFFLACLVAIVFRPVILGIIQDINDSQNIDDLAVMTRNVDDPQHNGDVKLVATGTNDNAASLQDVYLNFETNKDAITITVQDADDTLALLWEKGTCEPKVHRADLVSLLRGAHILRIEGKHLHVSCAADAHGCPK